MKGFQGYNSGVAIMNMNPNPGQATGNFDVYTATGIVDRAVWRADALATATVYLPNLYQVPNGFVGGAAAYVVATNQAPAPAISLSRPLSDGPIPLLFPPLGFPQQLNNVSFATGIVYQTSGGGLAEPGTPYAMAFTGFAPLEGTGISSVVNNINYNGVGDTAASYGGTPFGGLFNGPGPDGYGAGGLTGLVKNCAVGA